MTSVVHPLKWNQKLVQQNSLSEAGTKALLAAQGLCPTDGALGVTCAPELPGTATMH